MYQDGYEYQGEIYDYQPIYVSPVETEDGSIIFEEVQNMDEDLLVEQVENENNYD